MFKELIALDVSTRIPDFLKKIRFFSENVVMLENSEQASDRSKNLVNADALVVSIYQKVSEDFLKKCLSLHHIFVLGTSLKNLPLDYCQKQGIKIFNIVDYCDHETAEWVILQILKHYREKTPAQSVFKKTLGVVGAGKVGALVVELGLALGMKVFYHTKNAHHDLDSKGAHFTPLATLARECDIISAHTPPHFSWLDGLLLKSTKHNVVLINTCMGRISVGDELKEVLAQRADISLIMDSIAKAFYPELLTQALIIDQPAFKTIDSENRLIEKLFENIHHAINNPTAFIPKN